MAQKLPDEKKLDFSSLPRGAIGLKGLPVSRNTRLPSIRSPRDLTLGAPPKRTFMPNIPVRREKKSENIAVQVKSETASTAEVKNVSFHNDRRRGRGKRAMIQTESIFSEGLAGDPALRKEKLRESYQKSDFSIPHKGMHVKKEVEEKFKFNAMSSIMDDIFRDDFIDDGDDDTNVLKPTVFPTVQNKIKKEMKNEKTEFVANCDPDVPKKFDQNLAKEMGFDVKRVAQFIKKEKGTEKEEKMHTVVENEVVNRSEYLNLFSENGSELLLLQFPSSFTAPQKMDDSQSENSHQGQTASDPKSTNNQNSILSLPEGFLGKLQILKSGKARLLVGSLSFDLDSLSHLGSKHQVVSIRTDTNSGDLSVLGYMKYKLKFSPDVDILLR